MRPVTVALVLLLGAGAARAGDWTQFRGPGGAGVSDEKNLPVKWGEKENLRWKAALPGRGLSCPVIAGGRVYVTACSGYRESRLHVLCFEAATGKKLWERQFTATGNTGCNPKTCMAAPTPVTDGQNVYALFATGDLAALDAAGDLLWYRSLVGDYPGITNQVGMAASPVLHKDALLLPMVNAGDSFIAALDKKTGKNLWKTKQPAAINWTTPLVVTDAGSGRTDVLFQSLKAISAVDPETGKSRWTYTGNGPGEIPSPAVGDGLIFVPGSPYLALRPSADGTTPEVVWKSLKVGGGFASPLYHKDRVYGTTRIGLVALDAKTGEVVWQQRAEGPFAASPVVADGKLYAVNEKGTTYVVALGDQPELLATNVLNDTILATPALAGGALYLRSDGFLYCVGRPKAEK